MVKNTALVVLISTLKKDNNIIACDVCCGIDGQTSFDSLYTYQLNLLDKHSKLKYIL